MTASKGRYRLCLLRHLRVMGDAEFDISGSLGPLEVNDPTGTWDCHSPPDFAWLVVASFCWALADPFCGSILWII